MTALTDIDRQIAELEAKKRQLIEDEKKSALKKVELALDELNALGFSYQLVQADQAPKTRTRRSGVRDSVLEVVQNGNGLKPAQIAEELGIDDKAGKQSIANALTALKKAEKVTADGGLYRATA